MPMVLVGMCPTVMFLASFVPMSMVLDASVSVRMPISTVALMLVLMFVPMLVLMAVLMAVLPIFAWDQVYQSV
jgi:hypothetical protein